MPAVPDAPPVPSGPPSKALRNLVIACLMVCVVAAQLGEVFWVTLVKNHPLVLIALNARNRWLVLASPHLGPWSYYSVAFGRLLVSDPLFFVLGRWYGDAGVRWMERKAPTYGKMMRQGERWFSRAAYPLVAFAPNNFICLFAGASGMGVPGFFAVNMAGTAIRLYLLRVAADVFADPLKGITNWTGHHKIPILIVSLAIVVFSIWSERRAAGSSELGQLAHLDEEIAQANAAALAAEAHADAEGGDDGTATPVDADPDPAPDPAPDPTPS